MSATAALLGPSCLAHARVQDIVHKINGGCNSSKVVMVVNFPFHSTLSKKTWHGFKGDPKWPAPRKVAHSDIAGRADQGNTITASEYLDDEKTLDAKMNAIAELVKQSKHMCAYTGAGLSKASGIPDYASKAENSVVKGPKIKSSLDAQPTYAHCVLTAMERAGYLKHFVQQNHDGLPQKSGFPQEKINEIHGAWYDPSNPVVQFSESLRSDLFRWMLKLEESVDLTLALGTSLSGMNADRMAITPSKKARMGKALGTIVINLQRTRMDAKCTIRVWAKLDDAFRILAQKLGIEGLVMTKAPPSPLSKDNVFLVPYDKDGKLDPRKRMTLDLRENARIRVPVAGAMNEGVEGDVYRMKNGHFQVVLHEKRGPTVRMMGAWWIESALKGTVPQLPIVNIEPLIHPNTDSLLSCSPRKE